MSSNITSIKLSSGEEIIGIIDEETLMEGHQSEQATFILSRVFTIMPIQNENGIGFTFIPFMMSNPSGKIAVYAHSMVAAAEPSKTMQDKYLEITSGIKIAKDVPNIITK